MGKEHEKNKPLLKLGLRDKRMHYILDVQNGKACGCICPQCGAQLIARNKGKIKTPHFAHASQAECYGSIESAIHKLSKQILIETKKIFVPDYKYFYPELAKELTLIKSNKCIEFEKVEVEIKIYLDDGSSIVADAKCEVLGKTVLIEFANSHFIDDQKKEKLVKLGIPCLEFPISQGDQNKEKLTLQLHSNFFKPIWIVNKKGEELIEPAKIKYLEKKHIEEEIKTREEELKWKQIEEKKKESKIRHFQEKQKRLLEREKELIAARSLGNLVEMCPIDEEFKTEYLRKLLGSHNIIERLVHAGEVSPIYDRRPEFIDIFIDKKRVLLIPPGFAQLNNIEKKKYQDLLAVTERFIEFKNRNKTPMCNFCTQYKGKVQEYIICSFQEGINPKNCVKPLIEKS